MDVLVFNPIYQERVWGGRALESRLGRSLPPERVIGESWELVDRPEANSAVASGAEPGTLLRTLREEDPESLLGPGWSPARPFPVLVKWLDCEERLSLQVHPPADKAQELGGEAKTENWYVAEARPGAAVLAGLKLGVTRSQFEAALEGRGDDLEDLVKRLPTRAGDSLFVRSGRLHAIDAGNLILEIQENSDTTYRVYDWGRVGLDGQPRQLHLAESLKSIDFNDFEPKLVHPEGTDVMLADSEVFRLRRLSLEAGATLRFRPREQPRILSLVEGSLRLADGRTLRRGDNALVPYVAGFEATAEAGTVVLLTENFV